MEITLLDIQDKDFESIKDIYNYYVLNSTVTFHKEPVTVEELKEKIWVGHSRYKSCLIMSEGQLVGYCYISQYNKRQAYDRTAEISIYLKPEASGRGIGGKTIEALEILAEEQDIVVILGIISGDNIHSIKLFETCGYEKCGHLKQVGVKFGKVLDVVIYQKILR